MKTARVALLRMHTCVCVRVHVCMHTLASIHTWALSEQDSRRFGWWASSRPDKRGAGPDSALGSVGLGVFSRHVTFPALFLTVGLLLTDS